MSRQGQGLVTRSVSVGSTADVLKARNRAVPSGKRGNDENSKQVAPKKGRSAFGDITNRENAGGQLDDAPSKADALAQKNGRQQENSSADCNAATAPLILGREALPESSQEVTDMDYEACAPLAQKLWVDIDGLDGDDPQAAAVYAEKIMSNQFKAERNLQRRPYAQYMDTKQTDITPVMRSILVDWLVEVAQEYKLVSETLYLAVSYVDRYLSQRPVQRNKLQLVGVTCMLLASKYEEIYAPLVDEFCFITENTYTREEILDMEKQILEVLNFELTVPTTRFFLRRFVKAAVAASPADNIDNRLDMLASYLCELTLLQYQALNWLPSQIAASAVLLAQFTLSQTEWNVTLEHYTGYSAHGLRSCVLAINQLFGAARNSELPAIRDKYSTLRYQCISGLNPRVLPEELFL